MVASKGLLRTGLLGFKLVVVAMTVMMVFVAVLSAYSAVLLLSGGEMNGSGGGGETVDGPGGGDEDGGRDDGPLFITIPEEKDITTSLVGDRMTISAPLGFKNAGFVAVEDLVLDMHVSYNGKKMLEGKNVIGNVPGRGEKTQTIQYSGSVEELVDAGLGEVIYRDVEAQVRLEVGAKYVYGLVAFSLGLSIDYPWSAPVNISMAAEDMGITLVDNTSVEVSLPVRIRTAEWFSGHVDASLDMSIYSISSLPLGQVSFSADLGGDLEEQVVFSVPMDNLNTLFTQDTSFKLQGNVKLEVGGSETNYALSLSIPWKAPLRDVSVQVQRLGADTVQINSQLTNAMEQGKMFRITLRFYSGTVQVGELTHDEFVNPGGGWPFYQTHNVDPAVDGYVCTIGWDSSGPMYVQGGLL